MKGYRLFEKILTLSSQNMETKPVRLCPYVFTRGRFQGKSCSQPVDEGQTYCNLCKNKKATQSQVPEVKLCPYVFKRGRNVGARCNQPVGEGQTFCDFCSKRTTVQSQAPVPESTKKIRYCPYMFRINMYQQKSCDNPVEEGETYCNYCIKSMSVQNQTPVPESIEGPALPSIPELTQKPTLPVFKALPWTEDRYVTSVHDLVVEQYVIDGNLGYRLLGVRQNDKVVPVTDVEKNIAREWEIHVD